MAEALVILCGLQYVKDACHKTLIRLIPVSSRIPAPLPALSLSKGQPISGITQSLRLLRQAQHKSWGIPPTCGLRLVACSAKSTGEEPQAVTPFRVSIDMWL